MGVRTTSTCGAPASCFRQPGVRVQEIDRGLIGGQHRLSLQGGLHRVIEPGLFEPGGQPLTGQVHEPGDTGMPSSMPIRFAARSDGTFP